jgi:hypothetical protein
MTSLSPRRFDLALGALFLCVLVLAFVLARVAHAAGDPVLTATAGVDTALEVWRTDGPLWAGVLALYVGLRAFVSRQHWLAQGRLLAALTGALMVLAAALAWKFQGAPFEGILTAALAAIALIQHPTVPSGATSSSTVAGPLALMLLFVIGAGVAMQPGCAARQRGAAAAGAIIDCEAPDIAKLLPDLIPLAKEAVMAAIAGDGSIDTERLKADAAAIRGDLGRCVLAGAIAALATPTMARSDAPMSAELVLDAARLRGAFAEVRGELGWAEVHVAGSVL